jgi:hypothetical protein
MKIKCSNVLPLDKIDPTYPDLTYGNSYAVIENDGDYRIIGNCGEPALYDARRFQIVDDTIDEDWVKVREENDGEVIEYYYNSALEPENFFEKYHDGNLKTIIAFNQYILDKFRKTTGERESIISHPRRLK